MFLPKPYIFLLLISLVVCTTSQGQKLSLSLPYNLEKGIQQDLLLEADSLTQLYFQVKSYDVSKGNDSIQIYSYADSLKPQNKNGLYVETIRWKDGNKNYTSHKLYKEILQKNSALPSGIYHTYVTFVVNADTIRKQFIQQVDSSLSTTSKNHDKIEDIYSPSKGKNVLGVSLDNNKTASAAKNSYSLLKTTAKKMDKAFNKNGFTISYRNAAAVTYVDVFYQNRFVGYYKANMKGSLTESIKQQKERIGSNITTGVKNELTNSKTVFSQLKELHEESKKKDIEGTISLTGNVASGQEENSQNENNYYEVAGQVQVPVMNIPITLEGYYTSQDKNRIAKASYIRLHYDTEQAKAELLKLIAGYKNKYEESVGKGKGLENVYNTYLSKLQSEKNNMLQELKAETGVSDIGNIGVDTAGLLKQITSNYEKKLTDTLTKTKDSTSKNSKALAGAVKTKDTVTQLYNKAIRKYEQLQELERKMQKYYTLLEQYRNNNYFDSVLGYENIKDLSEGNADEKTYKELAKSAANILPEGKAKQFITGLTNLDAGIINKQVSSYTLNGQTLKGIDVGYDLGFCEAGFTYGRVEYVTRDGLVDKYNGYSGRASFKPAKGQKATLVYYGYMPSKRMLNEGDFFKDVDVDMPTFKDPIHIVSMLYTGKVTEHVNVEAEGATSFRTMKEFETDEVKTNDKLSYRIAAEGNIPQVKIDLKAGVEHVGKQFENNSLPMNMSGTDKYTAGAKGQFFQNFLTLGIEYNYLIQQNFASKSANSKWGFDIKTTSKRYPSVSLSYKPFTTFRSFTDTFNIPQRPILGEVWLGKLSYQIKKKNYTLRLTALYNKNTALVDTMSSSSNIAQLNAIYTKKQINLMANIGQMDTKADQLTPVHGKINFVSLAIAYALNAQWNLNVGQDVGAAKYGLSRYAANAGCGYRFKKTPLAIRANVRYNTYKLQEQNAWKRLYSGSLDMSWDFKFKMKEKS